MSFTSLSRDGQSCVFALLIGINNYRDRSIPNLRGAIPDCEHVKSFLEGQLLGAQIKCLYDEVATRGNILSAISALAFDSSIKKDDPILIYFAGHGAEVPPPCSWNIPHTGKIQMILPHDFMVHPTPDSHEGQGLFDRTLSDQLAVLSSNKGDNIVVILDSCHSGSGTRQIIGDPAYIVRGVELPEDYAVAACLREHDFVPNKGNTRGYTSMPTTHVLLAACREDQTAKESNGRGLFTSALLQVLHGSSLDTITYKELIHRLDDIGDQNPQCEGTNENRCVFGNKCASKRRTVYPLQEIQNTPDSYLLSAGEAHGITVGAEFSVHHDGDITSPLLGTLVVQKISIITSILRRKPMDEPFEIPYPACAVEIRKGNYKSVRVAVEDGLKDKLLKYHPDELAGVLLVGEKDDAVLKLVQRGDVVGFDILHEQCVELGMTRTHYRSGTSLPTVIKLLQHAAHFYFHLHRSEHESGSRLASNIKCELLPVRRQRNINNGLIEYTPEKDINERDGSIHTGGLVNVSADDGSLYGFKITNNHQHRAVYLWVFYFNQSDFSINFIHKPAAALNGNTVPCLLAGESLTIGYGRPGEMPFMFQLRRPGQQVDIGFLKLFVSTSYLDLSAVEQSSIMDDDTRYGFKASKPPIPQGVWDTWTLTIVQRLKH